MDLPQVGFRIVEVVVVLAEGDVVVMDRLRDRLVAVVPFQVEVVAPPLFLGRRQPVKLADEVADVGPIGDLVGPWLAIDSAELPSIL